MQFDDILTKGRLIRRYKRFLADIELETGETVVAHCANPGSMMGLVEAGSLVYLSANKNPKAKLDWRWELIEVGGVLVGINTARPNRIVEDAVLAGEIPSLAGYETVQREVKYGKNSRIDLLLTGPSACYVEVKSVTLRIGEKALFPDSVTVRGTKHLKELSAMVAAGHRAVMLYLVQRSDCKQFAPAGEIDPAYRSALREAQACGVEILCYQCRVTPQQISIDRALPFDV